MTARSDRPGRCVFLALGRISIGAAIAAGASAAGAREDPRSGLIAHWSFDEGKGQAAADSSGHARDIKLKRPQSWEPGKTNGGLRFLATDEAAYVNPKSPFVPANSQVTLSTWVKHDSIGKTIQRYLSLPQPGCSAYAQDTLADGRGL